MKMQEIEKVIENFIDERPINAYLHLLSDNDNKITEMEFMAIACKYFNRNEKTKHLSQKWLDDMAYCMSPDSVGVCLFFGFQDKNYDRTEYLVVVNDSSLAFANNTKEYLFHSQNHLEVWNKEISITDQQFETVPKGEIVYRKADDAFVLYYDKRLSNSIQDIIDIYKKRNLNVEIHIDEEFDRLKYRG